MGLTGAQLEDALRGGARNVSGSGPQVVCLHLVASFPDGSELHACGGAHSGSSGGVQARSAPHRPDGARQPRPRQL